MKKFFALLLASVMAFAVTVPVYAAPAKNAGPVAATAAFSLHQVGPINWEDYLTCADFGLSVAKGEDKLVPGYTLGTDGTVFWHFINPDKLGGTADITFADGSGKLVTYAGVASYKAGQHFGVVTPTDYTLISAVYRPATAPAGGATLFNLSHTASRAAAAQPAAIPDTAGAGDTGVPSDLGTGGQGTGNDALPVC